jgi:hypothetical protein
MDAIYKKNIGPVEDSMNVIKNTISYYIRRNNKILLDFRFKAFIIVSNCSHLVVTLACRRTRFIEEHLLEGHFIKNIFSL